MSDHSLKSDQVNVTQQIDSVLIAPLVHRLDILENSVVQISNIAANSTFMSLQTAVKSDITKIFEKLNATKASGSEKSATYILESQLNEKNKMIERLVTTRNKHCNRPKLASTIQCTSPIGHRKETVM